MFSANGPTGELPRSRGLEVEPSTADEHWSGDQQAHAYRREIGAKLGEDGFHVPWMLRREICHLRAILRACLCDELKDTTRPFFLLLFLCSLLKYREVLMRISQASHAHLHSY